MKDVQPQSPAHISPPLPNQVGGGSQMHGAVRSGSSSGSNSGQQQQSMVGSKGLSPPHHKDASGNNVIVVAKSDLNIVSIFIGRWVVQRSILIVNNNQ